MKQNILSLLSLLSILSSVIKAQIDDLKCDEQLKYFDESLKAREAWAVEFFDTWTKLQAGFASGNRVDLGHYDQCVEFRHKSGESSVGEIQGQHCMIFHRASTNPSNKTDESFNWSDIGTEIRARNLRLGGGYCLPASCSNEKVRNFIGNYLASADLVLTNDYDQSTFCHTNDPIPFETIDIIAIILSSILLLLLTSSTIYEVLMIHQNRTPHELYSAFSVYKNGKKLFDTSRGKSSSIIHCLPGLRTFSMLYILLGHRYAWTRAFPNYNNKYFESGGEWFHTWWSSFISVNPIGVDTFLVIGGCLISRSILSSIEKNQFNIPKMYLHRYLRGIPILAFLTLFILSLYKFMGSGPYFTWMTNTYQVNPCKKNFWAALLYIHNYYKPTESCQQASWYLSVDFQLVLLSPLILYPAYKWGWRFLWLLPTYIIGTIVWAFVEALKFNYSPIRLMMTREIERRAAVRFYVPTHIRMGPWLTGVILGYTLYKLKSGKVSVNKILNLLLWTISLGTIISILFGQKPLHSSDYESNYLAHAFLFAMQRNCWGLAIAWIIFSCEMGGGGIIKKFLELPLWRPLGRISLSFYLVHNLYIHVHVGSGRVPLVFLDGLLMQTFAGDIIVVTILAVILYLTFEEPILLIENYCYKTYNKKNDD